MLPKNDIELQEAFRHIIADGDLRAWVLDIAELICKDELSIESLQKILSQYNITDIRSINNELLDLLLKYINQVVKDDIITDHEKRNVDILKLFFKIKEGDFYDNKHFEIAEILHGQFDKLYSDNYISREEALHNFKLRDIFDLSHEQYDGFKESHVKKALDGGAGIVDLDTSIIPK